MLRKGSRSTRLWESPPIPSERCELRPCLCMFVARFDRRIFLLFVKNGFVGAFAEGNGAPLKQRQLLLMNTPLSQCHEWPTSDGERFNLRGVLKFTPPKWAQSVSYHMAAENSTLFSLNIGDSLTNNAWGKKNVVFI